MDNDMTGSVLPEGLTSRQETEMMRWLEDRQDAVALVHRFRHHPNQAVLHQESVNLYDRLLAQFGVTRPEEAHREMMARLQERQPHVHTSQMMTGSAFAPEDPRRTLSLSAMPSLPSGLSHVLESVPAAAAILPDGILGPCSLEATHRLQTQRAQRAALAQVGDQALGIVEEWRGRLPVQHVEQNTIPATSIASRMESCPQRTA